MEAKQTPLIDLLEGVPRDTVLVVEHDQFNSSSHPVGRLCHEAAAELRRLHVQAAQDEALLRQALDRLEAVVERFDPYIRGNECRPMENARSTIAALRERLEKGMEQKA